MNSIRSSFRAQEQYFNMQSLRLQEVVAAFRLTEYGKAVLPSDVTTNSYSSFCSLPLLDEETLAQNPLQLYLPSGDDLEFLSAGTTGMPKRVFYPKSARAMSYQHSLQDLIGEDKTIIVHSRRYEREQFYWIHDTTYEKEYPNARVVEYYDLASAVNAVKGEQQVFIYEYPSALYRFLFLLERAVELGLVQHKEIEKDAVVIELSGEPIDLKEILFVRQRVRELFSPEPCVRVGYGLTEAGGTGYFEYEPNVLEVRYRVADNVFVEVVDQATELPCLGQLGEIIVTPLRTRGTVLLRYRTGDLGSLDLSDGIPYLHVRGKPTEAAVVHVAGSYFSLTSLIEQLRARLRAPVQILADLHVDKTVGTETLKITVGTTAYPGANWSTLKQQVARRVVEMAQLEAEVQMGIVNIQVDVRDSIATNPGLRKTWRIIRREKGAGREIRSESEDPR